MPDELDGARNLIGRRGWAGRIARCAHDWLIPVVPQRNYSDRRGVRVPDTRLGTAPHGSCGGGAGGERSSSPISVADRAAALAAAGPTSIRRLSDHVIGSSYRKCVVN